VAEDSDLEKTESATPRRLEKAREEGQVARSRELASFALLAAGFFGIWGLSGPIGEHLQTMLRGAFTFNHASVVDTNRMLIGAGAAGREGLLAVLPVLITGYCSNRASDPILYVWFPFTHVALTFPDGLRSVPVVLWTTGPKPFMPPKLAPELPTLITGNCRFSVAPFKPSSLKAS